MTHVVLGAPLWVFGVFLLYLLWFASVEVEMSKLNQMNKNLSTWLVAVNRYLEGEREKHRDSEIQASELQASELQASELQAWDKVRPLREVGRGASGNTPGS